MHWLGKYHVQEYVSGIPPLALNPEPGEKVVDMCAAPGSKTTQISTLMDNIGEILANDIQRNRIRSLLSNISRLGCVNVQVFERDGRNLPEEPKFDKVLVDAPCSAEGNARKNSDLINGADIDVITKLSKLQENLLEKAFRLWKNGGTIVYSTCTFAPEENEIVVSKFLDYGKLEKPVFIFPIHPELQNGKT
ncbi:MAG: SAM-dependent methyltransferase [Methanohalobium sp.]|uniref:SAM-dependent methyltransferase n=1 Tax=Methanohalobium sp. TaxID=2837493 RepID=UPI00397DF5A7